MAHVAISRDFIARVESKIQVMRNAELKALGAEPQISINPESPTILKSIWGEHIHLRSQMPERWKNRNNSARLAFNTTTTTLNSDGEVVPVMCSFNVKPTTGDFEFPPNKYWHDSSTVPDALLSDPDLRPAIDYGNAQAEITQRWNEVSRKVIGFFQSCKSMKEAVTLWPDCKIYIDSDDIRRYETKVVKAASQDSEAAKVLAGINKDELVGAAVAARFTGVA